MSATGRKTFPKMQAVSGVYRLVVGEHFLIGASANLVARRSAHVTMLLTCVHPNVRLSEAFMQEETCDFEVLEDIQPYQGEPRHAFLDRLKDAERTWLDREGYGQAGCCNIHPDDRDHSGRLAINRKPHYAPEDPFHGLSAGEGDVGGAGVERKLSWQERCGGSHPQSKKLQITWPDGKTIIFKSLRSATNELGVSKQTLSMWLAGKTPWPGTGSRLRRKDLAGITGGWVD